MSHRDTSASAASQLANIASFLLRYVQSPAFFHTHLQTGMETFPPVFRKFTAATISRVPISPSVLALFIAYLFDKHYAPSTVNTYVSALGFSHKLMSLSDPTKVFYVCQMLKGYHKKGFRPDSRLLISLPILHRLILVAPQLSGSPYQVFQFQAMCSLAFYAFLWLAR